VYLAMKNFIFLISVMKLLVNTINGNRNDEGCVFQMNCFIF